MFKDGFYLFLLLSLQCHRSQLQMAGEHRVEFSDLPTDHVKYFGLQRMLSRASCPKDSGDCEVIMGRNLLLFVAIYPTSLPLKLLSSLHCQMLVDINSIC